METRELERFRTLLAEERETLRRQLADLGADPDEESVEGLEFDGGFADSAQTTAERARLLAMIEGLRKTLADVDHAIVKIDKGTYGICERCGKEIGTERLEALPAARLCVSCKQKESA